MNFTQISLGSTFLVLFSMFASKFINSPNDPQLETAIEIMEPAQELIPTDSFQIQIEEKSEPLSFFIIRDTIFGLPLGEVLLPSAWDVVQDKWIGPGNTYVKEVVNQQSSGYDINMDYVVQTEVLPVLNAMDKRITHLQKYPEIAEDIIGNPELDTILDMESNTWNLEVKGLEFEGNNGRKGLALIQLWSSNWDRYNYTMYGIHWMEGEKEFFSSNKDILFYAVQNLKYFTDNITLKSKLLALRQRINDNGFHRFNDFVVDEETGEEIRWHEYEDKQNTREKEDLTKELLAKGVCPDKIEKFWKFNSYDKLWEEELDYQYGYYIDDSAQVYDPNNISPDYSDWAPIQLDSLDYNY